MKEKLIFHYENPGRSSGNTYVLHIYFTYISVLSFTKMGISKQKKTFGILRSSHPHLVITSPDGKKEA